MLVIKSKKIMGIKDFLSGWRIKIDKAPVYREFDSEWIEDIDVTLAEMLLNDSRIREEQKLLFRRTFNRIENNQLKVRYYASIS